MDPSEYAWAEWRPWEEATSRQLVHPPSLIPVLQGPGIHTQAQGKIKSIYLNLIPRRQRKEVTSPRSLSKSKASPN